MVQTQQSFSQSEEEEEEEEKVRKESHAVYHKGRTCSRDARNTKKPSEEAKFYTRLRESGRVALWTGPRS